MAYAMTKRGSLDNEVTYEFICDQLVDMNAIEKRYRTIGSIAIVLQGESGGLEVYIAGSDKQWNSLSAIGGSSDSTGGLSIYICGQNEVNNGLPDISEPDETTVYLVPAGNTSGNLFEEYIYVDGAWEKFGAASIDLSNYIQKTDIATQSTAGLVKVLDNGNVTFNENNQLVLTLAGTAVVKTGQSDHPVSVTHQHEAAFYGLAKAAGQDMKNSNNAVGTYTTEAASAIRTMIGAGTYSKPSSGIPVADLASGVIPDTSIYAPKESPEFTGSISLGRKANTPIGTNSFAVGNNNTANTTNATAFGSGTYAYGANSFVEGEGTTATSANAHAEGAGSLASGAISHAEGTSTRAEGQSSHAEGMGGTFTVNSVEYTSGAKGTADHTEGYRCLTASNTTGNHAEGYQTQATGGASHSEGTSTKASGASAHAEGSSTSATNSFAHAEGNGSNATGFASHAEGNSTTASGGQSHAEGNGTIAVGMFSHAEGTGGVFSINSISYTSQAIGVADHVEGYQCLTANNQPGNHAEGYQTQATGGAAHSEGTTTLASGNASHAEGNLTIASGAQSHSEGNATTASGSISHAEGYHTTAAGNCSHVEGNDTYAKGTNSHAEGIGTYAIGDSSHVSGRYNITDGYFNWPEWTTATEYSVGDKVKVTVNLQSTGYICKTAHTSGSTFDSTKWNKDTYMNYVVTVGNGASDQKRSNAYTLDWDGNGRFAGDVYIGCYEDSTGGSKVATEATVTALTARVAALEAQIASLTAALEALLPIPSEAVTDESGNSVTDEQGNYIVYDTPTT